MKHIKYLLFLLLFSSFPSIAAVKHFTTSAAAFNACYADQNSGSYPGSFCQNNPGNDSVTLVSTIGSSIHTYRWAATCPTGQTPTGTGGQCVAPAPDPCAVKNGNSQGFTKSGSSGDGYGTVSGGYVAGVQSACFGGCAVSTSDQKCVGRVSGLYTCRGTAYFTGQSCSTNGAGVEIDENTSQAPPPVPQVITDNKPCVYSGSGDTQTCNSSKGSEKEGQYCGTVNGVKTCVDSKPTKNGINIDTTVVTATKPDGSKVITKTDVATKTVCTGAGQCTSTSTTTITTTGTDANGNITGVTGSCTGDACPDENGNPDGDGDGFGDCTGDDCGNGEGAVLEVPEFEEAPTIQETTADFMQRVDSSPLLSSISSIGLNGSGSCNMTSTNTSIGTISASSFCDNSHWLDPLYYIFLAIHALAAVRVFLSA